MLSDVNRKEIFSIYITFLLGLLGGGIVDYFKDFSKPGLPISLPIPDYQYMKYFVPFLSLLSTGAKYYKEYSRIFDIHTIVPNNNDVEKLYQMNSKYRDLRR